MGSKNNKAIQILRGSTNFDPTIDNLKNADLQDGQPFYSKKNRQLYVGDVDNNLFDSKKHTYFKPVGAANLIPGSVENSAALLGNEASASGALAIGTGNEAQFANGLVLGQYAKKFEEEELNTFKPDDWYAIQVGNGNSDESRLTSFSITNGGVATGSSFVAGNSTLNSSGLTISDESNKTEITKSLITCKDLKLTGGTTFSSSSSYNPMLINSAGELGKINNVAINPNSNTLDIKNYTVALADNVTIKNESKSVDGQSYNLLKLTGALLEIESAEILLTGKLSDNTLQPISIAAKDDSGYGLHVSSGIYATSGKFSESVTCSDLSTSDVVVDANTIVLGTKTSLTTDGTISLDGAGGIVKATTFYATSDKRLKENITPYTCKKSILDLPVYEFDYTKTKQHTIGCLAQDLKEICPEIVNENDDGYLSINESKLVYLLLEEVKQLKKRLDEGN